MKSPLRASEDFPSSMQSTPSFALEAHSDCISFASKNEAAQNDEDVWNVWPYCWAIAGHEIAGERFHWFHKKLNSWFLTRHNRRVLQRHRAGLQGWNVEAGARLVD